MKKFLDDCLKPVEAICHNFPWDEKIAYGNFLAQIYYYVCHSTRLLAFAAARFKNEDEKLHKRFLAHAAEEKGHQFLALNDLKALKISLDTIPELPETRMLYEPQYYKVEFQNPIVLMGYILPLEGITVKKGDYIYKIALKSFGKNATRFLQVHTSDDPDHIDKAFTHLEGIDTSKAELIKINIKQTCIGFQKMLEACAQKKDFKVSLPKVS